MGQLFRAVPRVGARWGITEHQATVAILGLLLAGDAIVFLAAWAIPPGDLPLALSAALMLPMFVALLVTYLRGWPYARQATVVLVTLALAFGIQEPYLTNGDLSLLIAPLIAQILAGPAWVLASAASLWAILLVRAGGQGIYTNPVALAIWAILVGGLIVSRLIVETSLRQAQAARREAEQHAQKLSQSEAQYRLLFDHHPEPMWVYDLDTLQFRAVNEAAVRHYGYSREEFLATTIAAIRPAEDVPRLLERVEQVRPTFGEPMLWRHLKKDGTPVDVEIRSHALAFQGQPARLVMATDVTERLRTEAARRASEERFRQLAENIQEVFWLVELPEGRTAYVSPAYEQIYGRACQSLYDEPASFVEAIHPEDRPRALGLFERQRAGHPTDIEYRVVRPDGTLRWVRDRATPIRDGQGRVYRLAGIAEDITAQKLAQAQIRRQLQRLAALRAIDTAITASLDLGLTLNVLLEQVTTQLGVHAADVLLLDAGTQSLSYSAGRGFQTTALEQISQRLGEGHAGRAALERRMMSVPDLRQARSPLRRTGLLVSDHFVSYYAMPLIAKGEVKGVLEIFHRSPLRPDEEWLSFLEALAGQAAIAVDNATLFEKLQHSNAELLAAYDATIEGWSRALDLRDNETEGHSQRVSELTLQLARRVGLADSELTHVRRGALLHDMGKLGVPDAILHKPGPLTDDEWVQMRQHPTYAYEMLRPISFLRPALDIPYCHHEKWDGTGYPHGLKGEAIPLAARLFAVVDVWDALRSDRPYRQAWSADQALTHISSLAGSHFDPRVVKVFVEIVGS